MSAQLLALLRPPGTVAPCCELHGAAGLPGACTSEVVAVATARAIAQSPEVVESASGAHTPWVCCELHRSVGQREQQNEVLPPATPTEGSTMQAPSAQVAAAFARPTGRRDAAVEDEIFHCGYFADVVFKFNSSLGEREEVYGQSALFSLLSPALRELLTPAGPQAACCQLHAPARRPSDTSAPSGAGHVGTVLCDEEPPGRKGGRRREVVLDPQITAKAFREVARYVYGLRPQVSAAILPDVVYAARALGLEELEELVLAWGLENLQSVAASGAKPEAGGRNVARSQMGCCASGTSDLALLCLSRMCTLAPPPQSTPKWRDALLCAYSREEVLESPAFYEVSLGALRQLLEGNALHAKREELLWQACVEWAHVRAGHRQLTLPREPPPASPAAVALSRGSEPRKLFGRGAKLGRSLAPPAPSPKEVEWQEPLLSIADVVRFWDMAPADFASVLEAMEPMLPQLRQAIYSTRRRGAREQASG